MYSTFHFKIYIWHFEHRFVLELECISKIFIYNNKLIINNFKRESGGDLTVGIKLYVLSSKA